MYRAQAKDDTARQKNAMTTTGVQRDFILVVSN
jgi:hypothetical protein